MTGHTSDSGTEKKPHSGPSLVLFFVGLLVTIVELLNFAKSGNLNLILASIAAVLCVLGLATIWSQRARQGVLFGALLALGAVVALYATVALYRLDTSPPNPAPSQPGSTASALPAPTTGLAPTTCGSRAANVSASLRDDEVNLQIEILCPPPPQFQYILISQPRSIDVDPDNPHPEYYLSWEMGRPGVGTYERSHVDGYVQGGAQVTYYVISVDDATFAQLHEQASSRKFVLKLPQNHTVVSNRETVQR